MLGGLTVVLRAGVLGFWLGIEVVRVGVFVLINSNTVLENEGCSKYYVIQAISSVIIFVGSIILFCGSKWAMLEGFVIT